MSLSLGDVLALGCALAWAIAVLLFRKLKDVEPDALNLFKNTLASVILFGIMCIMHVPFARHRSLHDWIVLAGSGVLGLAVADTLFFAGLRRIDASVAAITDCAYAPTVILLSAVFLREPLGLGLLLGAPLVIFGLYLATVTPRNAKVPVDKKGVLLTIGGVMMTALGVVLAKPVLGDSDLVEATEVRLLVGTFALIVFQVATGRFRAAFALFRPQPLWRFAIPATLFGTVISMLLWLGGMKLGAAARTALLNQLGAIFVLVLSRIMGEHAPRRRWVGAAIAIGGACVVLGT
ncbi:MAG: DMT family transporter [Polyangiaceae bacterium]|nr:DMT family transporter [Polyangiaceae bacterium]